MIQNLRSCDMEMSSTEMLFGIHHGSVAVLGLNITQASPKVITVPAV